MEDSSTTTVERKEPRVGAPITGGGTGRPPVRTASGFGDGGFFKSYKPEQGKATRTGTMIAAGALIAWGAYFIWDRLQAYAGDDWWTLLITPGIPIAFAVVFVALAWQFSFVNRTTSDFMIATEGEMKKVSWSSRREVIGSTKVVILFTIFLAIYLFAVDIGFQRLFQWIGVLKVAQ